MIVNVDVLVSIIRFLPIQVYNYILYIYKKKPNDTFLKAENQTSYITL